MAASTSCPEAPVRSATASAVAVSGVPQWTMLRRSLSSDAAASLISALARAAAATGSFDSVLEPHRSVGPPASLDLEVADDPGRVDIATAGGAGQRAGDDHRRQIDRPIGQILKPGRDDELGEGLGDGGVGHSSPLLGYFWSAIILANLSSSALTTSPALSGPMNTSFM